MHSHHYTAAKGVARDYAAKSTAARAAKLDLDLVNAQLLAEGEEGDRSTTREGSSSTFASVLAENRSRTASPCSVQDLEREACEKLLRKGGRPAYAIDLIDDVFQHPQKYHHVLMYFLPTPADWEDKTVFTAQFSCWTEFRDWQRAVRRQYRRGSTRLVLSRECLGTWNAFDKGRADKSLAAYAQVVKSTLFDIYGVDYLFQPTTNIQEQDKLSTWLEYLVFKHYISKYCATRSGNLDPQAHYERARARLVALGVLEPPEVKTGELAGDFLEETNKANEAVEMLERKIRDAKTMLPPVTEDQVESKCAQPSELEAELDRAKARLHTLRIFRDKTESYHRNASSWKTEADRHAKELPWVLEQLSVVWKETRPLRRSPRLASQRAPDPAPDGRKRKRTSATKPAQSSGPPPPPVSPSLPRKAGKRRRIN